MLRYGIDKVGQIVTFVNFKVGGGFRTLMRLKGYSKKEQDEVCKYIPASFPDQSPTDVHTLLDICVNPDNYKDRFGDKLKSVVKMSEQFTKAVSNFPWILKQVEKLENSIMATGAHAGGVLLFPGNSRNYVPSNKASGKAVVPVCQFNMGVIEQLQILKIDVLGLTTSRVISMAADKIMIPDVTCSANISQMDSVEKKILKKRLDIENIDEDDAETFEMLRNGLTKDVFQFASPGMTKALMDSNVSNIEDMIAIISLYRPGPLDAIDSTTGKTIYETYIECCQTGQDNFIHDDLVEILKPTRGCMIYQEQIMQVVMKLAGCTLGYADQVRRACAKKKKKLMDKLGQEFKYGKKDNNSNYILKANGDPVIKGTLAMGYTEELTDRVWDMIKKFASYAFNKSHAAAYAVNAFRTAYLKKHYPAEYMAEVLTALTDQEEIAKSVKECRTMGVPILPPDINKSGEGFTVEQLPDGRKGIRFGLQAIKGIKSAQPIIDIRPIKNFISFFNNVNKTAINKAKSENLILAGAFDSFIPNRHACYNYYHSEIRKDSPVDAKTYESLKKAKRHNNSYVLKNEKEFELDDTIKFQYENDLMGMYVSGHPLDKFPYKPWSLIAPGEQVEQVGILKKVRVNQDRNGRAYAFFKLECLEDVRDCVIWSNNYAKYGDRLMDGKTVRVRGNKRINAKGEQLTVTEVLIQLNNKNNSNSPVANATNLVPPTLDNPLSEIYNTNVSNDILYNNNTEINPNLFSYS